MEAFTTLVNVDEETAIKLVSYISSLIEEKGGPGIGGATAATNFLSECDQLIEEGNTSALIERILSSSDILFEADVESGRDKFIASP
jgi:hypothetical protein